MFKYKKGFTLVEMIIVIVIVGILSLVAVPIYRKHVRKAMGTEANSLLGSINMAEKVYFAEHDSYHTTSNTSYDQVLDVDARGNKYFTSYEITYNSAENLLYAVTRGIGDAEGISATLITDLVD